jgi:hypothetical protein
MILRPYLFLVALWAVLGTAVLNGQEIPSSSPSRKSANTQQHLAASLAQSAQVSASDQTAYRNNAFGFRYNVIVGWVNRTKQMQPSEQGPGEGQVLLAVFERPPEAAGDTVNSAVVIAQENASSYPGMKTAADYVGPLTELVTSKGFKVAGEPSEVAIDAKTLVRCDFTREQGKISMQQSTLILLQKGTVVSFTFIAGSQDEVDRLIDRLHFQRVATPKQK